jgi:hypothetical protein
MPRSKPVCRIVTGSPIRTCIPNAAAASAKSRGSRCNRKRRVKRQVSGIQAALKRNGKRCRPDNTKPPRPKESPPITAATRAAPRERRRAYVESAAM